MRRNRIIPEREKKEIYSIAIKHGGHATFEGKPSQESIDLVNELADLAYKMPIVKKLSKKDGK